MTWWKRLIRRILKYNTVSAMGLPLKFAVLTALVEFAGAGYLAATAIAVETVILHNFTWHLRWTWRDRCAGLTGREILVRLLKFQFGNGAVALTMNLVVMRLLVADAGIHYLPANIAATVVAGTVNFLLSEFVVFLRPRRAGDVSPATALRVPFFRT